MATDPEGVRRTTPCPSCGAALRPGSPWCTLCYADLRPKPPPSAHPLTPDTVPPNAAYGLAAPDPLTQPLLDFIPAAVPVPPVAPVPAAPRPTLPVGTWPCATCGSPNQLEASSCSACGAGFLAGTTARPTLVVPGVGDLSQLTRSQRLLVAAAAALVLILPIVLITALMSGPAPAPSDPGPQLPTEAPPTATPAP